MKKLAVVIIILVVVVTAVASYWYTFSSKLEQFATTSGTDHILEWLEHTSIETRLGTVSGRSNGQSHAFLGMRYGRAQRFRAGELAEPWSGTLEATAFGNSCCQAQSGDVGRLSEDCLFLNVFTPSMQGERRPVLFWIHGGSYNAGSGATDGSVLAEQGDVVVVSINYRLGLLGFLDLSAYGDKFAGSATNGISDQILALEWVRTNIADYGGDPDSVTIFGESAGGGSVMAIVASPSADGLYHRAINHSGEQINQRSGDPREALAKQLDVEPAQVPETLLGLSAQEVLDVQQSVSLGPGGHLDGTVVTRPSNAAIIEHGADGVPIIAGYNRDEGTLFSFLMPSVIWGFVGDLIAAGVMPEVSTRAYLDAVQAAYPEDSRQERFERMFAELLKRGTTNSAAHASAAGPGGWLYRFDLPVQKIPDLGATHGAEIAFTFNALAGGAPDSAFFYGRNDPVVRKLALDWSNTVIQFARTGNPNGAGLPDWPQYTVETREALILDDNPRIAADLNQADRARWGDTEKTSAELR